MQFALYIETLPPEIAALPWLAVMATWFGTGLVEPFQGFLAALSIVPLLWLTTVRGRRTVPLAVFVPVAALAVISGGVWFSLTGVADDGRIVIDEVAGMFVAALGGWKSLRWTLVIVPIYSFIDRIKPWPLSQVELFRKADVGVLLDDCAAGLAVALAVLLIRAALRRAGS
ncbi:phosphatidylglycerophosphatase A [Pseudaminobacter arsenicus]|uniref:Phosphatidylglycerophosphatase A n=2 Tax=Alphaproteobacteria TaxID=28211 RepID=A0A432V060_9HYPH|nr:MULTISPECIES: phosphatidylglycerophosphatase A [Phyllobacteriaceae]RUM95465.1 phosphatidylglycerophosphatase A [Pseudaminobacter arsenicus]